MFSRFKLRHAVGVVLIALLMTYQNCSQAPDSVSTSKSSYVSGLPFAYASKIDTIAYMSCSEIKQPVEPRAYFSYRLGAYNNTTGGVTLTDEFRSSTQYYSTTQRAQALASSDLNTGARLNLSVRSRSNMQSILSTGKLRAGFEIDSFLPPLDSPDISGPLSGVAAGRMMNYFPGAADKRLVEASLRFFEFENVSRDTRSNLEGSGLPAYLVAGYSASADELDTNLRSPTTNVAQAYGTAFGLSFGLPAGYSSTERRVLGAGAGVTEIDLTTGSQVSASWDCSASYQFMVVRPEDKVAGLAACDAGPDIATAAQQPALNAIRRVLRVEDWYVDMNRACVMPKRTGDYCYGQLQAGQAVNYARGACTTSTTTLCPHFVSVCIRH